MGRRRDAAQEPERERRAGGGLPPSLRPTKICPVCGRPFSWRRKWASVWEEVRYCSDRCRGQRRP